MLPLTEGLLGSCENFAGYEDLEDSENSDYAGSSCNSDEDFYESADDFYASDHEANENNGMTI